MTLTRLKNHIKLIRGNTCHITKKGFPYLSLGYLRDGSLTEYTKDNGVWVNDNDLLIIMSGGNAGEILWAKAGYIPATIAKIALKTTVFNKSYLYKVLKEQEKRYKALAQTSNFHHTLDINDFLNTSLNFIDIAAQQYLSEDYFNQFNQQKLLIEEIKKLNLLINEYKQSLVDSLFQTHSKTRKRLKDIAQLKVSLLPKEQAQGAPYRYISAQHIQNGKVCNTNTISLQNTHNVFFLNKNDIVVSLVGKNAGKVALIDSEHLIPSQSLSCIKTPYYLSVYFYLQYVKNDWSQYTKGAGLISINNTVVKNQTVPLITNTDILEYLNSQLTFLESMQHYLNIQYKLLEKGSPNYG